MLEDYVGLWGLVFGLWWMVFGLPNRFALGINSTSVFQCALLLKVGSH